MNPRPSVARISIWILEAIEKEWRREPDWLKCRAASQVLGPLKTEHGIEDEDIDHAIHFMCSPSRQYLKVLKRDDGIALLPSVSGLGVLDTIERHRLKEKERNAHARAFFPFFAGYYFFQQKADKQNANKPAVTVTNLVSHTSSQKSRISPPMDIEAQLR